MRKNRFDWLSKQIGHEALRWSGTLTWSNFLLACVNYNSCKGDTPVTVAGYRPRDRAVLHLVDRLRG